MPRLSSSCGMTAGRPFRGKRHLRDTTVSLGFSTALFGGKRHLRGTTSKHGCGICGAAIRHGGLAWLPSGFTASLTKKRPRRKPGSFCIPRQGLSMPRHASKKGGTEGRPAGVSETSYKLAERFRTPGNWSATTDAPPFLPPVMRGRRQRQDFLPCLRLLLPASRR